MKRTIEEAIAYIHKIGVTFDVHDFEWPEGEDTDSYICWLNGHINVDGEDVQIGGGEIDWCRFSPFTSYSAGDYIGRFWTEASELLERLGVTEAVDAITDEVKKKDALYDIFDAVDEESEHEWDRHTFRHLWVQEQLDQK